MVDYVTIYDTTLRDGEQAPGFRMNTEQKLEFALALERLQVDVIEAGFPASSKGDFDSVYNISKHVSGPVISSLARCNESDIVIAAEAIKPAIDRGKGKIHVFIATSRIHRKHKLNKNKEEILTIAKESVLTARKFTPFVEFSCEDFARTDLNYTIDIVNAVIDSGATTINLPDTVGYRFPSEIRTMVKKVIRKVNRPGIIYSIHAHNDLGLATANSIYAILAGARQVEVTMNGIGERAGNSALEEVVAALNERPELFSNLKTRIVSELIVPTSNLLSKITGNIPQPNKSITGKNAFRHSSGIHSHGILKDQKTYEWISPSRYGAVSELLLTARSGRHHIEDILQKKNIAYDSDCLEEIVARFKRIADNLNQVYDDSLVMAVRGDNNIPVYYRLLDYRFCSDRKWHADIRVLKGQKIINVKQQGNDLMRAIEDAIIGIIDEKLNIESYSCPNLKTYSNSDPIETVIATSKGYTVQGIGKSKDRVYSVVSALIDAANKIRYIINTQD